MNEIKTFWNDFKLALFFLRSHSSTVEVSGDTTDQMFSV